MNLWLMSAMASVKFAGRSRNPRHLWRGGCQRIKELSWYRDPSDMFSCELEWVRESERTGQEKEEYKALMEKKKFSLADAIRSVPGWELYG